MHPSWITLTEILYILGVTAVCVRIIYDTRSSSKTLAYLLLTIVLPIVGAIIYFSVGLNYRKRKLYDKKIVKDAQLQLEIQDRITLAFEKRLQNASPELKQFERLAQLSLTHSWSPLTGGNKVKLLINGEEKFKDVLHALKQAKHHIHIEYYIFEDGNIGEQIKEVLIEKARQGVEVRFIYDDFGSRSIRSSLVDELKQAGVEAYPFYRILFLALANRLNYRNHRKIIVIDGHTAFTGGINVSDRYINPPGNTDKLYWRDTHLRIDGPGSYFLQYLFIGDWNFCSDKYLEPNPGYFNLNAEAGNDVTVQVVGSGPDSEFSTILLSLLSAISQAKSKICITTPYFIPGDSLIDALTMAVLSGVEVTLLVPHRSDSLFVDYAAKSYYDDLLDAGVKIYQYTKGFIHAKTMVVDGKLCIVGTANMDYRSFDLNFEVNTIIYDETTARQLEDVFKADLKNSVQIDAAVWEQRPWYKHLPERLARLLSPLL
ncbi:cardiolipin synthase [Mucilaginibacter aquatilis]|uniref:Cardiolipin synthase n=1 Tax=Mucilaginibacter aquatilis TaxID=1517760 RepID=A0A6I4IB44_9SPHI|nr:cardiolipin synthase [Mucilaginibacter aquatilis]MVN91158.1 cardiolipin synthase [Mucilaginibacter aquatilis]